MTEEQEQTLTIQQAIDLALQHHQSGDLPKAEGIYQQILQAEPNQPVALHLLGLIAHQVGKNDISVDLITKALTIHPEYAEAHSNLGNIFTILGKLDEAVTSCNSALSIKPDYAEAHSNLGNALHGHGKLDEAVESYNKSIAIRPGFAEVHNNLGNTLQELGEFDEAVACYKIAIDISPEYAEAHNNLGNALHDHEKFDEAVACYKIAIDISPEYAEAHNNLGNALRDHGKLDEAVESFNKAIAIKNDFSEAHSNLGNALKLLGKLDEALTCYKMAIDIKPDFAEAYSNLGLALQELGQLDEAVYTYRKALTIKPDLAVLHYNLGITFQKLGKLDDTITSYNKALSIKPDYAEVHSNLGNVLKDIGILDRAVASYSKALVIKPDYVEAHSNLLLAEQYVLGKSVENLYRLHKDWDIRHAKSFQAIWPMHLNTPNPNRVLRIGFVSPDLGRHPVGYFLISLFENIFKNEIKMIVYSDRVADDLTDRFKVASNLWRDVIGVPDGRLSEIILKDEVDILFDLSGHSASRLLLFARKPAPIQVSWAGYAGTTGLSSMDYLLSDIHSTPLGEDRYYSEKVIRMPDGWLCYNPPDYAPEVGPPPFIQNGNVTFCSFSNPAKINEEVIAVWSRIMNKVENSRLLIKYKGVDSRKYASRLTIKFASLGVDKSRLIFEGHSPHIELLARYNDVDIALDPFPYSGGLTTYEALWMGVPVITVPGQTFASRHSLSHLSTIGLPELVAKNKDDYVGLAVNLAGNLDKIATLRAGLRSKMANSPSCDGKIFAGNFTAIMQKIWRDWCFAQNKN